MFSRALQFLAGRAVDAAGSTEGCFPAPQAGERWWIPRSSCPLLQPALPACPRRTIFGLNIPAHSHNLTVGMSIPISCKHFFRLKDPDCRRPSCDSAPCDFPGIRPGWAAGAASSSPARPAGRHLLIHPHLLLLQPDNATARYPNTPNTTRYRVAAKALVCQGPRLFSRSREAAACAQAGAWPRPAAGCGSRWGVFRARLEDNAGAALAPAPGFHISVPRAVRSWLEMPPRRMQKIWYQV